MQQSQFSVVRSELLFLACARPKYMMLVHENLEFSIFQTASKPSTNETIPEQIVVALQVSY